MTFHPEVPAGAIPTPVDGVWAFRQDNPGPMTLDGTHSYWIPTEAGAVVLDPGDDDAGHQATLANAGDVALILVSHRHHDHVGGLARLRELTGAPSRGADVQFCSPGQEPLVDGERIRLPGTNRVLEVLATPGHTSDSISLVLREAESDAAVGVLTADTILGRGTTIIDHPDGRLAEYLLSLQHLRALGDVPALPAHGGFLDSVELAAKQYLEHRSQRLEQVRAVVADLQNRGEPISVEAVTDVVYADTDPGVRPAAEHTVRAQLAALEDGA